MATSLKKKCLTSKLPSLEWIIPTDYDNKDTQASAMFPIIFVNRNIKSKKVYNIAINHERIHLRQQLELLIIPFYLWYFLEYFLYLIAYHDHYKAYRSIRFEKECWKHDKDLTYLSHRKPYNYILTSKNK
jgi:hypothetical protein